MALVAVFSFLNITSVLDFGLVFLLVWFWFTRPRNLPRGPKGHFLLGNMKDFGTRPELNFMRFAKEYGPVFRLYFANRLMVVLNGYDIIKEALVKHSDTFAGRPHLYINNTVTGVNGLSQLQFGTRGLKEQRKFASSCLREIGRVGKIELEEKIEEELVVLSETLNKLKGEPFEPYPVVYKAFANIICNICFGSRFEYDYPEFITLMNATDPDENPIQKAGLLQFVPWLRFLPFYRRHLKKIFETCSKFKRVIQEIINEHKCSFKPENEILDIIDAFLCEMHKARETGDTTTSFTDPQLDWIVGDLYLAGSETTARTLVWALALLVSHPDIYRRVQAEIEEVIGYSRLPKLSDRHKMPYTEATILEILRFSSIAPVAVPHETTKDVVLNGYSIPHKTFIFVSLWSIHFDPNTWRNPERFDPQHFLDSDGNVDRPEAFMPFSGGHRICPGESLAKMEIFMFLASLLQRFTFKTPEQDPPLVPAHDGNGTGLPKPFKLVAELRT